MIPSTVRHQLMADFQQPVQEAVRQANLEGVIGATVFLLDLQDERAQKMAAFVADLDTVRNIVTTASEGRTAPILIACGPSQRAAVLMRGLSRKAKRKFGAPLTGDRFRIIVAANGGITWAVGRSSNEQPEQAIH